MKHDNPQTDRGSTHSCARDGCKRDNYKERPRKDRPYLGQAMPKDNIKRGSATSGVAMKARPRSERQARRVAEQKQAIEDNKSYYQSGTEWQSPRR